ncbi:MAG: FAD binding domain-containing protein [Caldilineaceae bacterium]
MQAFDYVSAQSVDEVISLLAEKGDMARVLSGGTDLLVALREGRRKADIVIDVKGLPETTAMSYDASSGLSLGAAVPCHRMYDDKAVASAYPGLMDSAHLIGGTQIQGRASMGEICVMHPLLRIRSQI